jgi:predicted  nucleic acid-binding Zn-ribbon protein
MKREELEALGLTKEQVDKVLDAHHAELGPVQKELETAKADLNAANETVETQKTTIEELKTDLEEFKDADVSGMKTKIANLETDLQTKATEYAQQIADRDFQDMLRECITSANGRNAKAIAALLDLDALKKSKNQKEDVAAALKTLAEAEDSKMLFGMEEDESIGTGDIPGVVKKGSSGDAWLAQMMSAAGVSEPESK